MNLKTKNILYSLIPWIITLFFFLVFTLFVSLSFTNLTILDLSNDKAWIFWFVFFVFNSLYTYLVLFIELKSNEVKSNYFKFLIIFIFINAFIALVPMFFYLSLASFEKGSTSSIAKIVIMFLLYMTLLLFVFIFYMNLVVSTAFNENKILQIVNQNIWFFIFHALNYQIISNEEILISTKSGKFLFIYFLDESKKIDSLQFFQKILIKNDELSSKIKASDDVETIDVFENLIETKEIKSKSLTKEKIIEPDNIAKLSINYLISNPNNYFVYLNNNFEKLEIKGDIPKKTIIINEKNFSYDLKKILRKINYENE